jgi:hypothetical protein
VYTLRLYQDVFSPQARAVPDLEAQHSIVYVYKGSAVVNGEMVAADSARAGN